MTNEEKAQVSVAIDSIKYERDQALRAVAEKYRRFLGKDWGKAFDEAYALEKKLEEQWHKAFDREQELKRRLAGVRESLEFIGVMMDVKRLIEGDEPKQIEETE